MYNQAIVQSGNLLNGHTRSCGCLQSNITSARNYAHGMAGTKTYHVWHSMIQRCINKNDVAWSRYGGRGIKVCKRWRKFKGFFEDMGEAPEGLEIDRINNNGNYELSNCRWVTRIQNHRNKSNNRIITFNGKTKCVTGWADELGIKPSTIYARINDYGWSVERTLTQPVRVIKTHSRVLAKRL